MIKKYKVNIGVDPYEPYDAVEHEREWTWKQIIERCEELLKGNAVEGVIIKVLKIKEDKK